MLKPKTIAIEANASCQLRCPTCPTTGKGYPPVIGSGYLRLNNFKSLLDDNPQIRCVLLENRGEMFLNPELLAIMEYAFRKEVPILCNSGVNFNTVREEVLEGLVKYRFQSLFCSIDGATPDIYKMYRVGGDFNRVMEHIRQINHYKKVYNSQYPKLTWQFVVFGHNEHELPLAKKKAVELDMKFQAKMSWDADYSPVRDKQFVMAQTGWPCVTREEFEQVTGSRYMRKICHSLWHSPRINWDGRILGCCWNSWSEFGGNAFDDGYIACANNEKISYARKMLQGKVPHRNDLPCSSCELYTKIRNSGKYLTKAEIYGRWSYLAARFIYRACGLRRIRKAIE